MEVNTRCPACQLLFKDMDEVTLVPRTYVRVAEDRVFANQPPDEMDHVAVHTVCLTNGAQGR